jgi:ATP-dependent helicase/nuclease subunit B
LSNRIVLGPTEQLIEIVAARLNPENKDFSRNVVVFPGKRPAHFLRKELARRQNGSFIPPHIYSVDEFILSLYQKIHTPPVGDLESIDAVVLLFALHQELNDRLGGEYFTTVESFLPIGMKLFAELEELHLAVLPKRKLEEELNALTYNRLFSLSDYYTKFYSLIEERGLTTRAHRYSAVARKIQEIPLLEYAHIIVAGLFKQTHAEKIIFDEIANRPNALFVFQTEKIAPGWQEPEIHFIQAPDTHGQVFALSTLINEQWESKKLLDERSVIVLPSADALFPVVHQTLSMMPQEQFNIALGYPMERTPVFGFLCNLMELVCTMQDDRYSAAQYLKFALHPYTKNIRFSTRSDVTRILFHGLESMLTEDKKNILLRLEDLEAADDVFSKTAAASSEPGKEVIEGQLKEHLRSIHTHTIRPFEHIISLKEFAQKAIGVLTYIYEQSTAPLHPLFRPYAESFLQMFLKIESSLAGSMSFRDLSGYFIFLKQYVAQQEVPFTGTPLKGLQVLGLLETRNLQFDDVYLMNTDDDVLPGMAGSDMLLPQQLREKLGLETRRDREHISEYYFNLLIRGAKRVYLFFSESGESTKSRFIEQLLWDRQKRDKNDTPENYIQMVRYEMKLANDVVASIPKSKEILAVLRGFTYSASALDMYLQCPRRFYFRYMLRLKEKEEASEEIDHQEIGKYVHEVLKKFYEPCIGRKLEFRDLDVLRMEQVVNELFTENFGTDPGGASYLLKRQVQRQLNMLLTRYQRPVMETVDVVIKGLEENISIHALGANVEGRLDRVEQRGNMTVILDYKTGVSQNKKLVDLKTLDPSNRDTWHLSIPSLQLPIYLLLYSVHTGLAAEQIVPAYLFLGESRISRDSENIFVEDPAERAACFNQIQKMIELLLKEITTAAIPFFPPSDVRKTCPHCPYTALCGTAWVRDWKT